MFADEVVDVSRRHFRFLIRSAQVVALFVRLIPLAREKELVALRLRQIESPSGFLPEMGAVVESAISEQRPVGVASTLEQNVPGNATLESIGRRAVFNHRSRIPGEGPLRRTKLVWVEYNYITNRF